MEQFEKNMEHFEKIMEHFEKKMEHFERRMEHFEKRMEHVEKKMEHFEKKWNILRKKWTFWEILRNFHFFGHPSFYFSIRPFLCHMDLLRKKCTFWEKNGTFWEKSGSNQNAGRALCEKPYRSSPPFCAPEQMLRNFWEIYVSPGLPLV